MGLYPKEKQRLLFQREGSTYGLVYDPEGDIGTAFTAVDADYPHWRRFDIIDESVDIVTPLIEKIRKYDISDSKHASAVFSGEYEPTTFTIPMTAQGCEFLGLAVGDPAVTSHKQAMVQKITVSYSDAADNDYFLIDAIDGSGDVEHHMVWYDVTGGGSAPSVTDINASNAHEIAFTSPTYVGNDGTISDDSELGKEIKKILDDLTVFSASESSGVVTVTNANNGAVQQAHDSDAAPTGISVSVTTWGSTDYGITESTDHLPQSFTIHAEQLNYDTSAEDIVYDLFGCIVESVELNITSGEGVATYSVTFACPYAVEGNKSTNNPPRKYIDAFPSMAAVQESANNYLIQEYATTQTDRTPQNVESITLTINNNPVFKGDISKRYKIKGYWGKREITLAITGDTNERELFDYFLEKFTTDGTDWYPNAANGRLNSVLKLQRDSTYDYILISFYNWVCEEHNFTFVTVDEAIKSVDLSFVDGSSDSNGRIIDDFDFVSYVDKTVMVN